MDKGKFPLFGLKLFGKFRFFLSLSIVREYSNHRCLRTRERTIDRPTKIFPNGRQTCSAETGKGERKTRGGRGKSAYCKINNSVSFGNLIGSAPPFTITAVSLYLYKFTNWWDWISTIIRIRITSISKVLILKLKKKLTPTNIIINWIFNQVQYQLYNYIISWRIAKFNIFIYY